MNNTRRTTTARLAGVGAIAATYVYFLLFAEFAFLSLAERFADDGFGLRAIMAVLGAGGVAGSIAAARWFRLTHLKRTLTLAFFGCGWAAALAAFAGSRAAMMLAGGFTGFSLGVLTVTLASGLKAVLGAERLGWWCGMGTGAAYAVCNLPFVFAAPAVVQAWLAAGVALAGGLMTRAFDVRGIEEVVTGEHAPKSLAAWVAILLVLVWLDSAAFYVIQHAPVWKAGTWAGAWTLGGNALVHFAAAMATGWALDRGRWGGLAALAATALLAACTVLGERGASGVVSVLYTSGVSVYSTMLVFYPAKSGRAAVAGWVYAIAGWVGSALGIGLAQDLHGIPGWFLALAGAGLALAFAIRWRVLAMTVAATALVAGVRADDLAQIALGREVYIAEGCIHCHSQYVRPRVVADEENWGPGRSLQAVLAETPPLLGNRRQGPDLAEVGNRRSAEWQRLHLQNPRAVVPGSRMPAYDYLFGTDAGRGEALVAYLASLGGADLAKRLEANAAWQPRRERVDEGRGAALFGQLCGVCHGPTGRGDGPLAGRLSVRPPDFAHDAWRRVEPAERWAVERVVKFGLPGSPMAGHEYLSDEDVLALAAHVRALHAGGSLQ